MSLVCGQSAETALPLHRRLWIYQAERFPVLRNGVLILLFSASGVTLSAVVAGRTLPALGSYLVAFLVAFLAFFQLRVADEVKDAEDDRRFRPERPVPRGLIGPKLLVGLGLGAVPIQALLAFQLSPSLFVLLLLVWAWMALMAGEFGVPGWLRARPVIYLLSHMLIMPLIDLFVTGCEWMPWQGMPPAALIPFLLLSYANGCVLEIGRKTWAPENERVGVESYSRLWGVKPAVAVWSLALALAAGLTLSVGFGTGSVPWVATGAAIASLPAVAAAARFLRRPVSAAQAALDRAAGYWVLGSYLSVGLGPVLARAVG
jgi:4-hydroxybenzoate polyprenyltransferase